MNTTQLKKFAQDARRQLMTQVAVRIEAALSMEGAQAAENEQAIIDLKQAILETSKEVVTERVAYIWFNRLSALRFMDANNYTIIRTVSPAEGESQPELLAEARRGIIPDELTDTLKGQTMRQRVIDLLTGKLPSTNAEGEAYRLLLVAVCNYYHSIMPFMFEKIDDYSELLLPTDLLSDDSVVSKTVEAMDAEACEEVEVIGWLYQFYISEKKDEVFASKKKVSADNIPAATQLFTPNWIVRYLVENSLGRLWMLNNPDSRLKDKMDYYIEPEQQEEDFLKIKSPEELRICDPAVGSGHMLVYAFDLLYAIYEERGYAPSGIPALILEHNLYGIEIDERAGGLAAFALTMKARQKSLRFFRKPTQPNICVMENISFKGKRRDTLKDYIKEVGKDLFTFNLDLTLEQFEDAKHFGSLIRPELKDVRTVLDTLRERGDLRDDMFYGQIHNDVLKLLEMVDYLSAKYHVVVANPPYMGNRNMNTTIKDYLKNGYKDFKSDLYSAFTVRLIELGCKGGFIGMMTPFTWMFISSYEKLREKLLKEVTITNLVRPEYHSFFESAYVPICAFTLYTKSIPDYKGAFIDLQAFTSANLQSVKTLEAIKNHECGWFYLATASDFTSIPKSPIAYWAPQGMFKQLSQFPTIDDIAPPRIGMMTTDNERFLRIWSELSFSDIKFHFSDIHTAMTSDAKWFPYNKGGNFRKWAGNYEMVVNWYKGGQDIQNAGMTSFRGKDFYFKQGITWGDLTTAIFSCRYSPEGRIFDIKGTSCFPSEDDFPYVIATMNAKIGNYILGFFNPTVSFQSGDIRRIPVPLENLKRHNISNIKASVNYLIESATIDWDSYETSWDFTDLPLLRSEHRGATLADTYTNLRETWREMTLEMQRLEEENNRIFIEAYGLGNELTPDVPLKEITLTCNPHYRYGSKISDEKLEARLLEDTMKEFISYAVGCMFGRYALEKDGLILANQGETRADYDRKVPQSAFPADVDNVIPILTENWFEDDIVERFGRFLRVTFGDEHYEENLRFIESALGVGSIRDYFTRESRNRNISDFYDDHVKTYNKRPIYWMFASENNRFTVLIYMHRYRPDTVSVILNEYLREYRGKLEKEVEFLQKQANSTSASQADKTKAQDQMDTYQAIIKELREYEDEVLYPMATQQIDIDLDNGVKVNYDKIGDALYSISGLNK